MQIREKLLWLQNRVIVRINTISIVSVLLLIAAVAGWSAGRQSVLDELTHDERQTVAQRLEAALPPSASAQSTPAQKP